MNPLGFLIRSTRYLQPLLFVGMVIIFLMIVWSLVTNDYDDSDSVTITFPCAMVLGNQNQYPEIVITECIRLRHE
jgi:hypothetical protein